MKEILNDQELIKRCLEPEGKSDWEIFVRRYSRLIWNCIHKTFHTYSFSYTPEDGEDMYSSIFMSLIENDFRKLRQFRSENACALSTWLSIIATRMTIDFMRKDRSRYHIDSGADDREIWDIIPDHTCRADTLLENKQRDENLRKSLQDLSGRDRLIYDLIFNKGVSPEDTARMLDITVSTVYSRKHRIIEKIKNNIGGM
ncbi:MAG: sigma-70 family RNA polymerase sigma factor [Nitrospiraceae bacterium]|nr:MAG: sigma-70 family RNA polymerase sigma factor [Nitrospiraceae bacterium]